ncbi:MAG: M48 family metallopeptidase [Acidobacteriota bacterium]|nr:M48 family metallopeptidase [Acidobacteriota bacterium]
MLKKKYVLALPVFLFIASCGSGGLGGGVSLDEEWQLGNQAAAQVEQQVRIVNDSQATAYLRMVGERIHAVTPLAGRPFDFKIVNDSTVNAFSLPGGHIYINAGLIAQADKADMLAGVVAHEISHVVARHAIKQIQQQQEISVIGSILLGQNPNALAQIAAQVVAGGAMARFSRADEKQADDMGLDFLVKAGYDAHGMLDMFQKLLALDRSQPGTVARFFQDHPGTQDRIDDITGRISKMGRTTGIIDDPEYQVVRRRLGF